MTGTRLQVITTTDSNYLDKYLILLKSLTRNASSCDIHVRLVHGTDDEAAKILSINGNTNIIRDETALNCNKTILNPGMDPFHPSMKSLRTRLLSEKVIYCAMSKFGNARFLLESGYDNILAIDADSIVRKDLNELVELIQIYDFMARIETRVPTAFIDPNETMLSEGVMCFRNTPASTIFVEEMASRIEQARGTDLYNWSMDTIMLVSVFKKYKPTLKFNGLPHSYKDITYNNNTHIWSGQGSGKNDEKYISECQLYED